MNATERLKQLHKQLGDGYAAVQTWYFIYGLILFLVAGVFAIVGFNELWGTGNDPSGLTLGLLLLGSVAYSTVVLIVAGRSWHRQYTLTWRYLTFTSLPSLVIDEAVWDGVLAQARGNIALKATGLSRPRSLDELLELAGDYWRYILAVAGGKDAKARQRALAWDNGTRLYNNLVNSLADSCASYIILVALSSVLVIAFPLLYVALHFYIEQHAAKSAYVDYFLDWPRTSRKNLEPL